ncbi:MAG TPA: hypothetical protein VKT31_11860 [Solirubrobacteraceae bacterium]|nr:hypothetical protein [Solirubrobacteraceae bacterium]
MNKTVRNVVIVLAIAALVVFLPGGGTAARTVTQAVWLAFLASIFWFGVVMYRQNRVYIYALGDRRRAIVYVALGVAALTLTASQRMWASNAGKVAWVLLLAACVYAVTAVVVAHRRA